MNGLKTLKRLRGENDRQSTTVYVSQSILSEFKEACGEIPSSKVLEELMREFIDDLKPKARASILKKAEPNKKN